jgi:hypothetical protein
MGYVLPKGSSKTHTAYKADGQRKRRPSAEISVKLPEPVRIPPPADAERAPKG